MHTNVSTEYKYTRIPSFCMSLNYIVSDYYIILRKFYHWYVLLLLLPYYVSFCPCYLGAYSRTVDNQCPLEPSSASANQSVNCWNETVVVDGVI